MTVPAMRNICGHWPRKAGSCWRSRRTSRWRTGPAGAWTDYPALRPETLMGRAPSCLARRLSCTAEGCECRTRVAGRSCEGQGGLASRFEESGLSCASDLGMWASAASIASSAAQSTWGVTPRPSQLVPVTESVQYQRQFAGHGRRQSYIGNVIGSPGVRHHYRDPAPGLKVVCSAFTGGERPPADQHRYRHAWPARRFRSEGQASTTARWWSR